MPSLITGCWVEKDMIVASIIVGIATFWLPDGVDSFVSDLPVADQLNVRYPTAIAAPGCFATAAQLALYPLARAGLDVTPSLFAVTGSSGAGVKPRPTTHHPMRAHNMFAYSVLGHRHEAEVLAAWREWLGRPDATTRLMVHWAGSGWPLGHTLPRART